MDNPNRHEQNGGAPAENSDPSGTNENPQPVDDAHPAGEAPDAGCDDVLVSRDEYDRLTSQANEREDYLDRLRRAIAENMSLQNRMDRIRQNAAGEAMRQLARNIVPIADSLARACEHAENTDDADTISQGLRLVEKEFYDMLGELRIEPIEALGEPFDPEYHDAVYQQPTPDAEPNTVVGELKKGFLIAGQLLRPSQVVVAAAPSDAGDAGREDA